MALLLALTVALVATLALIALIGGVFFDSSLNETMELVQDQPLGLALVTAAVLFLIALRINAPSRR